MSIIYIICMTDIICMCVCFCICNNRDLPKVKLDFVPSAFGFGCWSLSQNHRQNLFFRKFPKKKGFPLKRLSLF